MSPWSHTDISRTPSPAYTRHGADIDMNYTNRDQEFSEYNDNIALNNLTVIVKNDTSKKSKLSKRHTTRQIAVPPVKEVFASGDNILVSVNFNKDAISKQNSQEPLKRKRQETLPILIAKKSKNTNAVAVPDTTSTNQKTSTKRAQNPKWVNRKRISRTIEVINAKPVAIIDLNTSPFREIEMSPKSVIVLTDSDEDKQVAKSEAKKDSSPEKSKETVIVEQQKPVEKNENGTQTISTIMSGGPKTPPEPVITISKPDNISTNSCEFNSQDEDHTEPHDVRGRGPNTPPEPPRSIDTVVSETAYDPFEPTKSNSPSPPPRIDMFEDDEDDNHNDTSAQPLEENKTTDSQSSISPQIVAKTITPPFLESQSSTQTDKSPEKLAITTTNTLLFTSPVAAKTPSPVQPTPTATNTDEIIDLDDNEDSQPSAFDNGADSPYSPGEGFVDEMKGSSPDSPVPQTKNTVSTSQNQNKGEVRSKMDSLLSITPQSKPTNVFDNIMKIKNLQPLKFSSKSKYSKHNTSNEDSVDDLPGLAVELESKNKFLEKLNRQERVIEEVKLVLKPHYNKKHITKEQYKDIMRKAVPKICHNKSGEINPQKIHSLIELYVIKYRHSHRKQVQRIPNK
jgi:PHD and RING finger domain-containing protein 1